jgi:adenylate cyclase
MDEGIAQMREGLAAHFAMGHLAVRPHLLAVLAEVHLKGGQLEEGLAAVDEALAMVHSGGRYYEAELYRLKGELLLLQAASWGTARDGTDNANRVAKAAEAVWPDLEACFRQAIEIARRHGAKCLELRAVMSLTRLYQAQGKKQEARQMLTEIYGWFTEGFDTADLKEAKALLEALSRCSAERASEGA